MINLKENPVGIDASIQKLQSYLYSRLEDWDLESFGRVEVESDKPLFYHKKNDYKEVLLIDSNTNGRFFFVDNEKSEYKNQLLTTEVSLIFLLDISKIKETTEKRLDEDVRIEILNLLIRKIKEVEVVKGQEVVSDFKTDMKHLHPYFFLKFSFDLSYQPVLKC